MRSYCLFIALLLGFVGHLQAAQSYKIKIKEVGSGWGGEGIYITSLEPVTPLEGCTNQVNFFMENSANTPMFEENMSMLIAAYMADKWVWIYVPQCDTARNLMQFTSVKLTYN